MPVFNNNKPYAVRLLDAPKPIRGQLKRQKLTQIKIAGEPIEFNGEEHKIVIGGDALAVEDWLELRRRIDLMFRRAGRIEFVAPPKAPWEGKTSNFLTRNVREIHDQSRGFLKDPPWILRPFFDKVVTKDDYDKI
jgi:hypothetical protein